MFKRFLFILTVCVFLLGMATKAEVENLEKEAKPVSTAIEGGKAFGAEETPSIKPEEEPALYRTEIKQITPNSGITTGHVIAYGHYIKPPYKVEIKNDTMLFINGVQIFPHIRSKFEIEKKRREEIKLDEKYGEARIISKPYRERLRSLFDKISSTYELLEPRVGRIKALDSIYKLAEAETLIVKIDTTFVGKDDCSLGIGYFLPGYSKSPDDLIGIGLELEGRDSSSGYTHYSSQKTRDSDAGKKYAIFWKNGIEGELRDGDIIFHPSFNRKGSGVNSWQGYRVWKILEILEHESLSIEKKIEEIQSEVPLPSEENIKELIYNFAPSEWPDKNK